MKVKYKKKRKIFSPFLLGIPLIISLLTISIGFSALSTTLTINGKVGFVPIGMIRVVSINQDSLIDSSENSKSFSPDSISVSINNRNVNSSATYNVNISNLGQTDKVLSGISNEAFTNDEMDYEFIGLQVGDVIKPKESINFQIKFKYKSNISIPLDLGLNAKIKFIFEDYKESDYVGYFKPYDGESGLFGFDKTNITSFERSTDLTLDEVLQKDGVQLISNSSDDQYDSNQDIYGWVENGIFYWWSEALIVYFHPNTTRAFYKFGKLTKVDLTGVNTEKVENFAHFFDTCKNLKTIIGQIDTSGLKLEYNPSFDYRNDTNNDSSSGYGLTYMFNDCNSLESVDLSAFNTTNASDMKRMFGGCKKITSLDVSGFDTSNVRSMYWMFRTNYNLTEIDLSSFDTSNVENMFGMFVEANGLQSIKLGDKFNTSKVKNMTNMFYGLKRLSTIYAKVDFVRSSELISTNMFLNTTSLVGSANKDYAFKFNSNYKDKTYAQLATEDQLGYFTPYSDEVRYTITYELDGGVTNNPFYYIVGSTITLREPIKPGYTFIGWTGSNGDNLQKTVTIDNNTKGNLVYYANYDANHYTIIFDSNNGLGQTNNQEFTYNTSSVLNENNFTNEGYVFTGWNTEKDGTGISFENGQSIVNIIDSGSITLYAQWKLSSNAFKTLFEVLGPCNLNGENANIMGELCDVFAGYKSINSGISLFSEENYKKDFEISFDISNYNYLSQESTQATILNSLLEKNGNPGFVLRRYNSRLQFLVRNHLGETNSAYIDINDGISFKVIRKNNNICYSVNNGELKYINNFNNFNKPFDLPVYFGASIDPNGKEWRNITATLSNINIKLGISDDSVVCDETMQ